VHCEGGPGGFQMPGCSVCDELAGSPFESHGLYTAVNGWRLVDPAPGESPAHGSLSTVIVNACGAVQGTAASCGPRDTAA